MTDPASDLKETHLKEGDTAPQFTLPDQNNQVHRLKDYQGNKRVLLYFYGEDDTRGWTVEAVNFTRSIEEYESRGVAVLGVSTDSVASHLKFHNKYRLKVTLLSDEDATVCQLYGVAKITSKGTIRARRVTFLIDANGKIEKLWDPVKADGHNAEVLTYLRVGP